MSISRNGTENRVYGGDACLIHCADGTRATVGQTMADELTRTMKLAAFNRGDRSYQEMVEQALCPGCYMIVGVDMLVTLAKENGQPLTELAYSMVEYWTTVADTMRPDDYELAMTEHIVVVLDEEEHA